MYASMHMAAVGIFSVEKEKLHHYNVIYFFYFFLESFHCMLNNKTIRPYLTDQLCCTFGAFYL